MNAVDVLYLSGGGMVAVPLLAVCVYWTRRLLLDAADSRRESASPPAPSAPASPPSGRGVLVPIAAIPPMTLPPADWWLSGWQPTRFEPAVIGDAMATLLAIELREAVTR